MKSLAILTVGALVLVGIPAHAGSGSGLVSMVYVHETSDGAGVVMFETENNSNKAACSNSAQWAFKLGTPQGEAMYTLLLTAHSQNRRIDVHGAGECTAWGDRERPVYIRSTQ